jgi:hypothetical protein
VAQPFQAAIAKERSVNWPCDFDGLALFGVQPLGCKIDTLKLELQTIGFSRKRHPKTAVMPRPNGEEKTHVNRLSSHF